MVIFLIQSQCNTCNYCWLAVKENVYSWQITFNTYQECELFYETYNASLLNGLLNHGRKQYGKNMGVDYLSCAKVEIDENFPEPNVLGQKVLYSVGS